MKWISVKDMLPSYNTYCLTFSPEIKGCKYRILMLNNGKFTCAVTHWTYLIDPPKSK